MLKMHNKTEWSGRELRKLFLAALKAEGAGNAKRCYNIHVEYRTSPCYTLGVTGMARLDGSTIWMYLPTPARLASHLYPSSAEPCYETKDKFVKQVAKVFVHELGHNLGLKHKEMVRVSSIDVSWSAGMVLTHKRPAPKVKKDLQVVRSENAKRHLAEHEKKLKREQGLVRKWRKKVRYYEKALNKKRAANNA